MITLLASIAGFLGSIIPDLIKMLNDKRDKSHEVELLKLQIKSQQDGFNARLEEIQTIQSTIESKSLYSTYVTGVLWVDALNGSVRPVLAYAFFGLYSYFKYLQYNVIVISHDVNKHLELLWSVDDQAIFAGIISFYFGQRAITKLRGK